MRSNDRYLDWLEALEELDVMRERAERAEAGLRLAGAGIIIPQEEEVSRKLAEQLVEARSARDRLTRSLADHLESEAAETMRADRMKAERDRLHEKLQEWERNHLHYMHKALRTDKAEAERDTLAAALLVIREGVSENGTLSGDACSDIAGAALAEVAKRELR